MTLLLITRPSDALSEIMVSSLKAAEGGTVTVVEMTQGVVDYDALVESIFSADAIQVW